MVVRGGVVAVMAAEAVAGMKADVRAMRRVAIRPRPSRSRRSGCDATTVAGGLDRGVSSRGHGGFSLGRGDPEIPRILGSSDGVPVAGTDDRLMTVIDPAGIAVVWFKRDLRLHDHAALRNAAASGTVLPLFIQEPELLRSDDIDASTIEFAVACAAALDRRLQELGGRLIVRQGEAVDVLDRLFESRAFGSLHAHEETGGERTYARDLAVARWCRSRGVRFVEAAQHGVVRRLRSRDGWAGIWASRMRAPEVPDPTPGTIDFVSGVDPGALVGPESLGLGRNERSLVQPGGEAHGLELLRSFLHERGRDYRAAMSSPVHADTACSRLSPHLAWGSLSIRRAHQMGAVRQAELRASGERSGWAGSIASFQSRLRWHCHFMQKLEDEPAIEHRCMNPAFEGLRDEWDESHFEAWRAGRTGYPMVDAVMRSLQATGWATFRMRAMLVSFACHHLQIDWRPVGRHLARLFLDYEPGIHWSQCQMQAGVTGINTVRIYSPARQVLDQDPTGIFIRRWVPELADVPDEFLAEPHRMPPLTQGFAGCRIDEDYPAPIVDHATAYRHAKSVVFGRRGTAEARAAAREVQKKHGSRRRGTSRRAAGR